MKIKRERWGEEQEEDRRGTDEGTQRGDDETGREKCLSAGKSWRLPIAPVQSGSLVQLRPRATLAISTKHAPCCKTEAKSNPREGDRGIPHKDIVFLPLRDRCTKAQKT